MKKKPKLMVQYPICYNMTHSSVVLGLGFGDEGKGLTTSYLCSKTKHPLVVRFNGGHQVGHTVVYKNKRHVFSNFGSGTLQGVPTYWSKYCTFNPTAFLNEWDILYKLKINPIFFINPLCPVTTPYDIAHNQYKQDKSHGTVGVGFGSTIKREEDNYHLFVQDLFYPDILFEKLNNIRNYYGSKDFATDFINDCLEVCKFINIKDNSIIFDYNCIFEGAQGILLDKDFGFFPNVTRSNTTCKNITEGLEYKPTEIYYVTRSYLTRHGNGYFPQQIDLHLKNNKEETNIDNQFQGKFKISELKYDLIKYALQCDNYFSKSIVNKNLVITCTDQYPILLNNVLKLIDFKFDKVFISKGNQYTDIVQIK